jgi:hypothetical protein
MLNLSLAVSMQGSIPPPTSGSLATVLLGLTAFSAVVVVAAAWGFRSLQKVYWHRSSDDSDTAAGGVTLHDRCQYCGEPLAGQGVCGSCGIDAEPPEMLS